MATPLPPFAHARHRGRVAGLFARALSLLGAVVLAVVSLGVAAPGAPVSAVTCGSFQGRVDAAASGSTITIPSGCVFNEDVEIRKALTINAAKIFGADRMIGTLEPGKIANLVVVNGDPLEIRSRIQHVVIAGRDIPRESKHTELFKRYMGRQ